MTRLKRSLVTLVLLSFAVPSHAAPDPREILKASLALVAATPTLRVRAVVMGDELTATGQKLQRNHDVVVKIRRPDAFRAEVVADRFRRSIRYDGRTLVVFDPERLFYGRFDAPPTIDATLADARTRFGLEIPLGLLFDSGAPASVGASSTTQAYVGLHHVDGVLCHHLAFTQDSVDWQIWISAEGPPLPRRIVIDFKNRPGRPQFIALLSDWNLAPRFEAGEFDFVPPAGSHQIAFLPAEAKK